MIRASTRMNLRWNRAFVMRALLSDKFPTFLQKAEEIIRPASACEKRPVVWIYVYYVAVSRKRGGGLGRRRGEARRKHEQEAGGGLFLLAQVFAGRRIVAWNTETRTDSASSGKLNLNGRWLLERESERNASNAYLSRSKVLTWIRRLWICEIENNKES